MNFGFENHQWYVEYDSCQRAVGNMYEESDRRALKIAETSKKIMLSFSSGIDSQSMLLSFLKQHIPVETCFMYLPGYNDNEYQNLKIVNKKFGIKTHIIDIDPHFCRAELEAEAAEHNIQINSILQKKFLSLVPSDYDFVAMVHDPYIYIDDKFNFYWYQGHYSVESVRWRAFELVERSGKFIFFGDSSEFLASILNEELLWSCLTAWRHYKNNGINRRGSHLNLQTEDRWDFYVKPFIYGKYWKDELIYFPKFSGFENISYLQTPLPSKEHAVLVPLKEFVNFLNSGNASPKRYYQNLHMPSKQ